MALLHPPSRSSARGNEVFVFVGPLNQHDDAGEPATYDSVVAELRHWLEENGTPHHSNRCPRRHRTRHPLQAGYQQWAAEALENDGFRRFRPNPEQDASECPREQPRMKRCVIRWVKQDGGFVAWRAGPSRREIGQRHLRATPAEGARWARGFAPSVGGRAARHLIVAGNRGGAMVSVVRSEHQRPRSGQPQGRGALPASRNGCPRGPDRYFQSQAGAMLSQYRR